MSREIKFRAWDKTYNFMSYKVLVGNTDTTDENYTAHCIWVDSEKVDYKREPGWMNFDELSDKALMQYTGLKDKNGKEIYEGDIVEYNDYNSLRTGGFAEDKIIVGKVIFSCGMWMVEENNCGHDLYEGLVNDEEFEVIGNIYENPELLEATA